MSRASAQPGRVPVRWILAAILTLASILNYIDRQALSILAATIQRELGISDRGYAAVVQCFLACYAVMYLVSGRLVDWIGARIAETLFIVWWSAANLATAFVTGAASLAVTRGLLGMGEPGNFTAAAKAVAEWFPPREKAVAVGLFSMGGTIGAAIAAPLVSILAIRYGWRAAFVATGIFGVAVAALWLRYYRRPGEHPQLSLADRQYLERQGLFAPAAHRHAPRWRPLLSSRALWLILVSRMITDPLWYFYLFWFPKYLQDARGFTLGALGRTVWVIFVAADCGCLLGGWLSGRSIRSGAGAVASRLRVMGGAALALACSFAVPLLPGAAPPLAAASLFALAHMAWMTNSTTLPIDLFSPAEIGTVQGAIGAGSSMGGFISAGLIGWIVSQGSYTPVFLAMSVLHPLAFLLLFGLLPRKRELAA